MGGASLSFASCEDIASMSTGGVRGISQCEEGGALSPHIAVGTAGTFGCEVGGAVGGVRGSSQCEVGGISLSLCTKCSELPVICTCSMGVCGSSQWELGPGIASAS